MKKKPIKLLFFGGLAVLLLTLITWYKVLFQVFDGEGFQYFNTRMYYGGTLGFLFGYDTFVRLIFNTLILVFQDKIILYQLLMLLAINLINLSYYLLVYKLTHKIAIAFMATVFFGINFSSSYEMYGLGNYQFFIQRVLLLPLAFLSFWFLVKFIRNGKRKRSLYYISVLVWWLATFLAKFNLFFLPIILIYPFGYWFKKKEKFKKLFYYFLLVLPFLTAAILFFYLDKNFVYSGAMKYIEIENKTISETSSASYILGNIMYQLAWISLPRKLILLFSEPQFRWPMIRLAIPILSIYLIGLYYLYRKEKLLIDVYLTTFFFIPVSLFLNCIIRSSQIFPVYEGSRYFFIPFIGLGIFLAILLHSLLLKKNLLGKLLVGIILGFWIFYNINLVWFHIRDKQILNEGIRISLTYAKENAFSFPEESLVFLPKILEDDAVFFCNRFYSQGRIKYMRNINEWGNQIISMNFDLGKVYVLGYDFKTNSVIDKSKEFRELYKKGALNEETIF